MFTDKEERQIDGAVRRAAKMIDYELERMFRALPESAAAEMAMRLVGNLLVQTQPPFLIEGLVLGLAPDELGRLINNRAVQNVPQHISHCRLARRRCRSENLVTQCVPRDRVTTTVEWRAAQGANLRPPTKTPWR